MLSYWRFILTANLPAEQSATPLSEEAQAIALWTFIHLRTPRFTSQDALALVRDLAPTQDEDAKQLAKRLTAALSHKGVRLKHTNAVIAASQLLGHRSWHEGGRQAAAKPLQVYSRAPEKSALIPGWREAVERLVRRCDALLAGGAMKVFRIQLTSTALVLEQPYSDHESACTAVELERVEWDARDLSQLAEATRAAGSIRRHFEETGRALVDGVAAAQYCLHTPHEANGRTDDPVNSELVVDLFRGAGITEEVARGDELRCWHELHWFHKEVLPEPTAEGDWVFGNSRYGWSLTTIRADVPVPEIIRRALTPEESQHLLRRYLLAARTGLKFLPEDRVKRLSAMRGDVFQVDVDWHRVGEYMLDTRRSRSELEEAFPGFQRRPRLARAEFEAMVNWLELQRPQEVIRKPRRSELALLKDDEMIRAFVSRVQDVVHEVPRGLPDEHVKQLEEAVGMLHLGLRPLDIVTPEGRTLELEPRIAPYLIHANAGEDLLATLKKLNLVAYAGLTTNVKRGSPLDWVTDPYPFELHHVLFLDIDYAGEQAK
jgi:hypothetical protein